MQNTSSRRTSPHSWGWHRATTPGGKKKKSFLFLVLKSSHRSTAGEVFPTSPAFFVHFLQTVHKNGTNQHKAQSLKISIPVALSKYAS